METKICKKCCIEKNTNEFSKSSKNKDGLKGMCKLCWNNYQKNWNKNNKDRKKESSKRKYEENKNIIRERAKIYYENNKEKELKRATKWRKDNPEKVKIHQRNRKERKRETDRNYHRKRAMIDPIYKLQKSIRNSIRYAIKKTGYVKKSHTHEILGCSYEEFKIYLESKFEPWMTWENKGLYNGDFEYGWDIDHIEPLFPEGVDRSEQDIIRLNHYMNLQPLCSKINRDIKKNKIY